MRHTDSEYYALTSEGIERLTAQSLPDAIREGSRLAEMLGSRWVDVFDGANDAGLCGATIAEIMTGVLYDDII